MRFADNPQQRTLFADSPVKVQISVESWPTIFLLVAKDSNAQMQTLLGKTFIKDFNLNLFLSECQAFVFKNLKNFCAGPNILTQKQYQ